MEPEIEMLEVLAIGAIVGQLLALDEVIKSTELAKLGVDFTNLNKEAIDITNKLKEKLGSYNVSRN